MAFFYENIDRLADGEDGREEMALLPAFLRYQMKERRMAGRLKKQS